MVKLFFLLVFWLIYAKLLLLKGVAILDTPYY